MASKRQVKRRTCERKIDYRSLGGAVKACKRMREKYGEIYSAYQCQNCNGFHIGHRNQSTRAKLNYQRKYA